MLLCAESAGRLQTMQEMFVEHGLTPHKVDDFAAFLNTAESSLHRARATVRGHDSGRRKTLLRHRGGALPKHDALGAA